MERNREKIDKNGKINDYITVLEGYLNNEVIECRKKGSNENWLPISNPTFNFDKVEYRIKPKPIYRSYTDGNEAFEDMQNHSSTGWLYNTITMCYEHIICIGDNGISTCKENYSFEQALKIFIYPNDLPFGVKLDEED